MKLFFDYLARFSGDVALMFAAKGGLYLYGGVVQKLSALIEPERFRTAFEAKARSSLPRADPDPSRSPTRRLA